MTISQEISVDIFEEKYFEYLNVKQADNVGRVLITTITAKDETLKPDKDTEQAVFRALKPDGTSVIDPATIREDGKVEIALSAQTLACDGQVEADISIIRGETILSTATFYIQVARAPLGKPIQSENEFLLLIEAREAAEAAAKSAGESAAAAAESERKSGASEQSAGESAEAAKQALADTEAAAKRAEASRAEAERLEGQTQEHEAAARESSGTAAADALRAEEAADLAQRIAQGGLGYYATDELLREKHPEAEDGNWAIVGSTDTIWVWDSDTSTWTDSGNKTDLSQYYTRTETDELLTGLSEDTTTKIEEIKAGKFTVTLPASGWASNAQTIADARLVDGYDYIVDVAGACIKPGNITVTAGQMTVTADVAPTTDVTWTVLRFTPREVPNG